jgi:PAS domain S-box-containing protein
LANVLANIPGSIYWKDRESKYLGCNEYVLRIVNAKSVSDIIGKSDVELFHFSDIQLAEVQLNDKLFIEKGITINREEVGTLADGKEHIYAATKAPLKDTKGNIIGVIGTSIDITERKRLETKLAKAREKEQLLEQELTKTYLDNILANVPGSVYWKDREGRYLGCNAFVLKMAGLDSQSEIIGKTDYDLPWKKAADLSREVDISIMKHGPETLEEEGFTTGSKKICLLSHKSPLRDKSGNIIGIIGVSIDITEKKQLENKLAEAREKQRLLEQTRFKASANMAHEIRNPLAAIQSSAQGMSNYFSSLCEAYVLAQQHNLPVADIPPRSIKFLPELLDNINDETQNAESLLETLLTTVIHDKINEALFETCSVVDCVNRALKRFPPMGKLRDTRFLRWQTDIDFEFFGPKLAFIHVLFNLMKNSYAFTKFETEKDYISIQLEVGTEWNYLYFMDTGAGIPAENLARLFKGYFTTRISGMGVGLPFCRMVMQGLKGEISCQSEVNKYTKFILKFPK